MHHSLEVRVPLLDHPLVEYVLGLPDSAKRRPGLSKALLVESLEDLLPADAGPPDQEDLHVSLGTLAARAAGTSGGRVRLGDGLDAVTCAPARRQAVQSVWQSFLLGQTGWARPWSLFVLNEWVRKHLDEAESPAEPASSASRATTP